MIYDKESDERNHIGKNDEDRLTDDIEVLKLVNFSSKRERYIILTNNLMKEIR